MADKEMKAYCRKYGIAVHDPLYVKQIYTALRKAYLEGKMKEVTCNKCGHKFTTEKENKDIRCPKCKSNESFSIR